MVEALKTDGQKSTGTSLIQQYQDGEKQHRDIDIKTLSPVINEISCKAFLELYKRRKTAKQIAQDADIHSATARKRLNQLENKGFIQKAHDSHGPGRILEHTQKGERLAELLLELHKNHEWWNE